MQSLLEEIESEFIKLGTPEGVAAIRKFAPTAEGEVYGVRMPQLNTLSKKYKEGGIQLSRALWQTGGFEHRMLAVKLLEKVPKGQSKELLSVIDEYKDGVSDWAICDTLGMQGARKALKYHPAECYKMAKKYIRDEEMWVIRLGIVLLIHFTKNPENRSEIPGLVKHLEGHKEHYIKKAMVWLKKNLEKHGH